MDKTTSKELAKAAIDRFILRFDESYRQLIEYAALPFVLTPELLNYIHNQFLWNKVEWVAEVDLLLSDLCRPIGYEQYAMDNSVRNYLLEKMNQTSEGREQMQKVARLLLSYIHYLGKTNPYIGKQELEAQQWGAMVCLNDQRETAVKEIVSRFLDASGKGSNNKKFNRDEFARLVQIVQELEPQLSQYKSLVDYAKLISKLLSQESVKEVDLNHSYSVIPGCNLTFPEELVEEVLESQLKQEGKINYTRLRDLLAAKKWREADEETYRLMVKAADRELQGSLNIESIEKIPCLDLRTIDQLWLEYSRGHFGFSVQKQIYQRINIDLEYDIKIIYTFGERLGWLKKVKLGWFKIGRGTWLNYSELDFSLNAPRGHLPCKYIYNDFFGNFAAQIAYLSLSRTCGL